MFPFNIEFQHYKSEKTFHRKRRSYEFIVDDETLRIHISYEKEVYAYYRAFYMWSLAIRKYGKHPVSPTDGGTWVHGISSSL